MSTADEYKAQFQWRDWTTVLEALPAVTGKTIVDLGCGIGDLSAELVKRGAYVIGLDMNRELLEKARSRGLPNTEFSLCDLRDPLVITEADGLWCSFLAAYFPELDAALRRWTSKLNPGGWVALTEVDDLFAHEPLADQTQQLFADYGRDALAAGRYDFLMGRKLRAHLERANFSVLRCLELSDRELAFDGPADSAVVEAWRKRFDRMKLLQSFCGANFEQARDNFLQCLSHPQHKSYAKVHCCIGMKQSAGGEPQAH